MDFDNFYGSNDDSKGAKANEEEKLPPGFENLEEVRYYKGDKDFMRYHKRTRRNMHGAL